MDIIRAVKAKKPQELSFSDAGRKIIIQAVYFLLGVLVSKGAVLGTLAPFGASFAAAVPLRFMLSSVAGSVLGYILMGPVDAFRYIAVVIAIGALRWLLCDITRITKSRLFAPLVAFVPVLVTGVTLLFVSTSRMSEFSMCVIEAVISGAAAYFIARTAELVQSSRGISTFDPQEAACLAVSACILILSFGTVTVFTVSVGRCLAILAVLLCARYGGVGGGSISGIATGVMFSLSSSSMAFLGGGYAFGGLAGGLFAPVGKVATAAAFALCNTVLSVASGEKQMVLTMLIETAVATAAFLVIPKDFGNRIRTAFMPQPDIRQSEAMRKSVTTRLDFAATALENVTECVNSVSQKLKKHYDPAAPWLYENAAQSTCSTCGLRVYCWDKQKEVTLDDFGKLSEPLFSDGFITDRHIDESFTKKCCKRKELAKSVNEGYREYLSAAAAQRRITQVRSVVAGQFSGLSVMLSDLAEELADCDEYDTDSADRIIAELRHEGFVATDCTCVIASGRGMTVELFLAANRKNEINKSQLHKLISACCGRRFDLPCIIQSGESVRVVMTELAAYDIEIGTSQHIAGNAALCGDCLNYFSTGAGSMVAIISDGMGTGGAAAVDSNMAVSIMSKLIRAGLSYDCALSIVNSSLMIKSEEESLATLDIADINLFSGKVSLYKAGSPVTYIRRSGRVLRRESPSLPVGILNEIKFSKDAVTLHDSDRIVMVSDGAVYADDKWLEDTVRSWNEASAADLASIVVNEAIKRRNDGHDDDITAIAIRLIEA